jgi:quercetin dioxygenase-like cupin family protein
MTTKRNWRTTTPTGKVRHGAGNADVIKLFASEDAHLNIVDFKDGARTDWHTQPRSVQYLFWITDGGVVGTADGVVEAETGDLFEIPAGERHWHGARKGENATHLSILYGPEELVWEDVVPGPVE